jgi:hypothetical protein
MTNEILPSSSLTEKVNDVSIFISDLRRRWKHADGSRMIQQDQLDELVEMSRDDDEWWAYEYNGGFLATSGGYALVRGGIVIGYIASRCS